MVNMNNVLAGLLTGLLAGCASTIPAVYQPVNVEIPEEPVLLSIRGDELLCLSDDVYSRMVQRERDLRIYAWSLRVLLETVTK